MPVTVTPEAFTYVNFDAARIAALAERLAGDAGLPPEHEIVVRVEERSPLGVVEVLSLDPLEVKVDGGALEDPKHPRQLADHRVADVLGLAFLQARDRLDPEFAGPELGQDLPLPHRVAWDVWAVTRLARHGWPTQPARRRYHFRNRHGFTDEADEAFDRIWAAERLTWADLVALSDGARSPTASA